MDWPAYFPEHCPPGLAKLAAGVVYRIVSNSPPGPDDFVPVALKTPHRDFGPEDYCRACGLSVHSDIEASKKTLRRYPRLGTMIAEGVLTEQMGVVVGGRHHHITWWVQGADSHQRFDVVVSP